MTPLHIRGRKMSFRNVQKRVFFISALSTPRLVFSSFVPFTPLFFYTPFHHISLSFFSHSCIPSPSLTRHTPESWKLSIPWMSMSNIAARFALPDREKGKYGTLPSPKKIQNSKKFSSTPRSSAACNNFVAYVCKCYKRTLGSYVHISYVCICAFLRASSPRPYS